MNHVVVDLSYVKPFYWSKKEKVRSPEHRVVSFAWARA